VQEFVQMGSVTKSGKNWRAQVRIVGYPGRSKSFEKKTAAWLWVEQTERELKAQKRGEYPKKTVQEALQRYREEEAPKRDGARWEVVRTRAFERYDLSQKLLRDVTDDDIAHWREARLKHVSGPTVRRELGLWKQVFEAAREQWRWIPANVVRDVKAPPASKPNPKAVPQSSIDAMVGKLWTGPKSRQVALGFLLGCETGMRPWEMLSVTKDQVFWRELYLHLEKTKNGDERDVPLSPGAIQILAELDAMNPDSPTFFTVPAGSVTELFGEARDKLGLKKLHFRHSRRVGIKRLSERLPLLDLARAVGHRNLNSLQHYYHSSASDMAKKLGHQPTPSPSPPSSAGEPPPKTPPAAET
jgi:integrase